MKGDGAGGSRVRLRAAWRRIPRRRRPRRPGGPAARRSACVLHAVAMFVQQQVAVVVACVCGVSLRSCACEKNCCCLSVLSQPQCYRGSVLVRCAPDSLRRGRYTDRRCYCYTRRCYFPLPQHPDFTSSPTCLLPWPRVGPVTCQPSLPFLCHVFYYCRPTRAAPASSSTRIASSTRCAHCSSAARAPPTSTAHDFMTG